MKPDGLPAAILAYVRSHHTMTLATCAGNRPWAAAVFYACEADGASLYFVSDPGTRHCRQLAANPAAAATIHAHDENWRSIRGVQLEGRVEAVDEARRQAVVSLYLARFPELARLLDSPADEQERRVSQRFATARFYALRPTRLRFIDNSRGFGHREEFALG